MALIEKLNAIGNAIRAKTGKTEKLTLEQMATEISTIQGTDGRVGGLLTATIAEPITVEDLAGAAKIKDYCCYGCVSLPSVDIPDSVTSIGTHAFYSCKALTSIVIPDSVTNIGSSAFYQTGLKSILLSKQLTSIGGLAFYYCSGLTAIELPDTLKSIGNSAFKYCIKLSNIIIPNEVTTIGSGGFEECWGLKSAIVGSGVTSIDDKAFYNTYNCESITVLSTTPPKLGSKVFFNSNATIYVPRGCAEVYKAATNWSEYADRIQEVSE